MTQARIELTAIDKTAMAVASAKKNLQSLGDTAAALPMRFGTLGIAVATAFSAVTMKGAIDAADNLDDLAEKTGIAVESLAALRYAGEVTGTPLEAIANGTRRLATTMADAADGNKEAVATFKALNIEVKNADGSLKGQDAMLLELADRFASYRDGAEKSALAQQVFGKSGADMIPLLNQGSAGIRALRAEAEALGAVYSGDLAKQAADFNDNLKKLELNAEAAKVQLVGGLLPALNSMVETYIELAKHGVVWTAIEQSLINIGKHVPVFGTLVQLVKQMKGGHELTGDAGADINRLMGQRAAVLRRRQFAEGRGLPTAEFDKDLQRIEDLLKVSRVYQASEAQYDGDTSDAMSRRMRTGSRGAAPLVKTGGGSDKAAKEAAREADARRKLIAELAGLQASFAEDWQRLNDMYAAGAISLDQLTAAQAKLLEQQPFMQERVRSEKELAEIRERAGAMADKSVAQLALENDELAKSNQSLGEQVAMIGLTSDQVKALTLARMEANLQMERERLLQAQNIEGNEREVEQIQRRIRLLEQQKALTGEEFDRKESAEFADDLRGDLKGAFQRAFEDSKDPGKAFIEALASTLYTRVSTALADAVLDNMLGDLFGGGGGGGGGGGIIAGIASLFSFDGGGSTGRGPRAGGLDGKGGFLAMLHPQESVYDHYKGRGAGPGGGQQFNLAFNYTIGDVVSRQQLDESLRLSERRMLAGLQRSMKYGGGAG